MSPIPSSANPARLVVDVEDEEARSASFDTEDLPIDQVKTIARRATVKRIQSMVHGSTPGKTSVAATPGNVVQMHFEAGRKIPLYRFDSAVYVPSRDIDDTWEGEADAKEEMERMEMGDGDTTPARRTSSSERIRKRKASFRGAANRTPTKNKKDGSSMMWKSHVSGYDITSPGGGIYTSSKFNLSNVMKRRGQYLAENDGLEGDIHTPEKVSDDKYMGGGLDGSNEILTNWRMQLVDLMESLPMNFFVISLVMIDIGSILYFELGVEEQDKDCEGRDTAVQQQLTVLILSFFVAEIILKCLGRGFGHFFALRKYAVWNWFDFCVIALSVVLASVKYTSDLSWVIKCLAVGPDLLCPPLTMKGSSSIILSFEKTCNRGTCPHVPPSPYSTSTDNKLPESYRICGQGNADDGTQTAKYVSSSTRIVSRVVILLRVVRAFMGLNKVRRIGSLIRVTISSRASKGVRRFRTMGFDLDLTYITDRTVIMASPAHDKLYTKDAAGQTFGFNDAEQIARFLATRHYGGFRVYNLCQELIGDYAPQRMLCHVHRIPVPERCVPLMSDIMMFCANVERWLLSSYKNIVAIHCSDGTLRSGIMTCAWLMHCGHRMTAEDALDLFARRRSGGKGLDGSYTHKVDSPAATRVLQWLEQRLYCNVSLKMPYRVLKCLSVDGLLPGGCYSVQVKCQRLSAWDSFDGAWGGLEGGRAILMTGAGPKQDGEKRIFHGEAGRITWDVDVQVWGHVQVSVFKHASGSTKRARPEDRTLAFYLTAHTAFVDPASNILTFRKKDLDIAHLDVGHKNFSSSLSAEIILDSEGSSEKTAMGATIEKMVALFNKKGSEPESFRLGQTIIKGGDVQRKIYMVKSGIVAQVVMESAGSSFIEEAETVIVDLFGPGDVFGACGFCLNLPDTQHVCRSHKCEIICLEASEAGLDDQGHDDIPNCSIPERVVLYKGIAAVLSKRHLNTFFQVTNHSRVTSFHSRDDQLLDCLQRRACRMFRIPFDQPAVYVHRCKVMFGDQLIGRRLIFFNHYLLIDSNTSGTKLSPISDGQGSPINKSMMYYGRELEIAYESYPDIQNVIVTISGIEYECLCGYPTGAQQLLVHLNRLLDNHYLSFERAVKADTKDGPKADDFNNRMAHLTPVLAKAERVTVSRNEKIIDKGEFGVIQIVYGSAIGASEGKVYEVKEEGSLIGEEEFYGGLGLQLSWFAQSEQCEYIYLERGELKKEVDKDMATELSMYREGAQRLAAKSFALLLKSKPVAMHQSKMGDEEILEKEMAEQKMLEKLLKMRTGKLLKNLDLDAIRFIAEGARRFRFQAGHTFIKQGDKGRDMYCIVHGQFKAILKEGDSKRELGRQATGEILGEGGWITGERGATIVAVTESEVAEISASKLAVLADRYPEFQTAASQLFQERLAKGLTAYSSRTSSLESDGIRHGNKHASSKQSISRAGSKESIDKTPQESSKKPDATTSSHESSDKSHPSISMSSSALGETISPHKSGSFEPGALFIGTPGAGGTEIVASPHTAALSPLSVVQQDSAESKKEQPGRQKLASPPSLRGSGDDKPALPPASGAEKPSSGPDEVQMALQVPELVAPSHLDEREAAFWRREQLRQSESEKRAAKIADMRRRLAKEEADKANRRKEELKNLGNMMGIKPPPRMGGPQ